MIVGILFLVAIVLGFSPLAYADNCGSLQDCFGTMQSATGVGVGIAVMMVVTFIMNRFNMWESYPENPDDIPYNIPEGANIYQNIQQAQTITFPEYINKVRQYGAWDYKTRYHNSLYEPFGNFNYGVTASARGWPRGVVLRGAGAVQIINDYINSLNQGRDFIKKPETDWPWGEFPFGDNPDDPEEIQKGIDWYKKHFKG